MRERTAASTQEIAGLIVKEFEVERSQADKDVRGFVQELLDKGLVTRVG